MTWRCRTCGNTDRQSPIVDFWPPFPGDKPTASDVCPECDAEFARTSYGRAARGAKVWSR